MRYEKILFLFIFIFLASCGEKIETNMSEPITDFEFTTQDEEMLSSESLKGDWWIANFMYTNCRAICPRTTANMADVQKQLKMNGYNPHIVSFSVEPSHDTPGILKEYARQHNADLESWDFLTGYDFETIKEISENTFNSVLEEGAVGQRAHGINFYLVNPNGIIVKEYNGMGPDELDMLIDDLKTVLES
ncbi:SCO family protein [Salicibibacter kimchii]|uniref:SCO family protein n=1 Tax=Salicibibacter kimchii TaxID=2099786 RepID=A0A345C1C6_9BACI|nr:SCO family protein [Salicibibacter kimchii]AXF57007.1 SCO family protein [Salicibibacter kimchii]